ncbi:MAG TPA: triose-phosphate isomerase [Dehalococcoidia bacterium]
MAGERVPVIAGNWKMHTTTQQALDLCRALREPLDRVEGVEKVVCPPYVHLRAAADVLSGTTVGVGAQNVHWEEQGAYTGEISPVMLAEICRYVIIGHSERRAYFAETDETVRRKVAAALARGLIPIMCVGETLEERESGRTDEVVTRQVRRGLDGVDVPEGFIIAYEPVWAIGTGRAATGALAAETIDLIRRRVAELAGAGLAATVRILYGGSVTPENIDEFLAQPGIDGALVGGASLKAESFLAIARSAERAAAASG